MNGAIPTADAAIITEYETSRRSLRTAYVLWLLLGVFGAHRFYAGQAGTGVAILLITCFSLAFFAVGLGLVTIWVSVLWVAIDAMLIPGLIELYNTDLARRCGLLTAGTTATRQYE
jgi:TM2 domain-containing membrane protein YozV